MSKIIPKQDLYSLNIVSVKIESEKRTYVATIGEDIVKNIKRTKYLKICWHCGSPYESYRSSSYACSSRCSQNIIRRRKNGLNPASNIPELTKAKNTKEIKEQFGYR